jgi:hypothetical protein
LEGANHEERIYGALGHAKGKIDRAISIDNHLSSDLAQKLLGE